MSGRYARDRSNPQATPQEILDLYKSNLPDTLMATYGQAAPVAGQLNQAADVAAAGEAARLQQYVPGYQQTGIDIANRQAQSQADLLGGAGRQAALGADALNRTINPNYYRSSDAVSSANTNLLSSFGPGATLSGGELAGAERAINQQNAGSGNLGLNNLTNLVGNALNFGQYARQKQQLFGSAIGQVNATLPNLVNPTFNPVTTALGAGSTTNNFGLQQYNPALAMSQAGTAGNFGQGVLSGAFGAGSAQKSSGIEKSGGVADCCFIFMESYNGDMPWAVRRCRDRYYRKFPAIAAGYKKMAKWLVPLMKRHSFVRNLVWAKMVFPLTQYGRFVTRQDPAGKDYKSYRKFWFTVWNILGKV